MQRTLFKLNVRLKSVIRTTLMLGCFVPVGVWTSQSMGQVHQNHEKLIASPLESTGNLKPKNGKPHPKDTVPAGPRFKPRGESPYPDDTESSGVRNDALCPQDANASSSEQMMRALVPARALKLTASGRPTFWIALPQTQAKQVILSIEKISRTDTTKTLHAQKSYFIPQTPTIMGLPMPDEAPALDVNTFYKWSVILLCGETPHPSDPFIFSSVKRESPSTPINASSSPLNNATALSQDGFWYDSVTILLDAYQQNPQDLALVDAWQSLMKSAGLEAISEQYGPTKSLIHSPSS